MKPIILMAMLLISTIAIGDSYKTLCKSKGIYGDSANHAIANCMSARGHSEESCSKSMTCKKYSHYCESKGLAGNNVADAVSRCVNLREESKVNCLRSVHCL